MRAQLQLIEQLIARRPDLRLLTAQNGRDGITLAQGYFLDVILMDINLPGINGIETMKLLRLDKTVKCDVSEMIRANPDWLPPRLRRSRL